MKVTRLLPTALFLYGILATPAILRAQSEDESRIALVMGVTNYVGTAGFSPLPGIEKDLELMKSTLEELKFRVTVVESPTLAQAEEAIDTFGAELQTKKGVGLFYFSGHGGEFEGQNYLIPKGARITKPRDVKDQAITSQRVLGRMEDSGARICMVFLDCCRNDMTKAATSTGLAAMTARGTFIGFATASSKTAAASDQGSPYTTFLAQRMKVPGLSVGDMHTFVTRDVQQFTKEAGEQQTPFQYSGLNDLFYFKAGDRPPVIAAATPPALSTGGGAGMATSTPSAAQTGGTTSGAMNSGPVNSGAGFGSTSQPFTFTPPSLPQPPPMVVEPPPRVERRSVWLFPDSSSRYLTTSELDRLDGGGLWRARNEIYARNGFIFQGQDGRNLVKFLGNLYSPVTSDQTAVYDSFNNYERANVDLIREYEKRY